MRGTRDRASWRGLPRAAQVNELDLEQLACGDKGTPRYRDLETYNFVLGVAWDQADSVSPDEANLLSKLRRHLRVNEFEHRVLEAKLRRFPKTGNELAITLLSVS